MEELPQKFTETSVLESIKLVQKNNKSSGLNFNASHYFYSVHKMGQDGNIGAGGNFSLKKFVTANDFISSYTTLSTTTTAANDNFITLSERNYSFYGNYDDPQFANFTCDVGDGNGDSNGDGDEETSVWQSVHFKATAYLMYIGIFVFALLGNGTVCYIVQSTPRMRTVTNYFIANLAVGDILMSLFCVPFSFVSIFILNYWPFGVVLCHLVNYSQAVSVLVSAYTLVAISVDRYIAIMWPLRPRITKR